MCASQQGTRAQYPTHEKHGFGTLVRRRLNQARRTPFPPMEHQTRTQHIQHILQMKTYTQMSAGMLQTRVLPTQARE
jgi:hypothetical protein